MSAPDTRPETRAEPIVEDHTGRWYPNKMPSGQVVMARTRWPEGSESDYTPYKVVANIGGVIVEGAGLMGLTEARMAARVIADSLAQPTQPDAVEALTYTIVEWGDLGPMCFTSQDANRVTLAEAKEALERILSNNPYNRRFTICAVHPVPSALTTDEEGA